MPTIFRLTSMENVTGATFSHVKVQVVHPPQGGISRTEAFEFDLDDRYDMPGEALTSAIREKLAAAKIIEA